jgi:ribokinase
MKNNAPALTIIGDVGVDVVMGPIDRWPTVGTELIMERSELRPGGSGGNTALAAHYLGAPCRLLSLVGNDAHGTWLAEQFDGISASLPVCNAPTSVSVGIIHACGERTFLTTRGHLEVLAYEHVRPFLTRARHPRSIVLLSGVFLTPKIRADYTRLIDEIIALGHEVALDTGWPSGDWDDSLRLEMSQWISKCDHVLLNEAEVLSLGDEKDFQAALLSASRLMKPGASLIVKTGAKGAVGLQHDEHVISEAVPSVVFDTIGAGDSFNAGYLLGRLNGYDLADALDAGCNAAAAIISRFPRQAIKPGELADRIAPAQARAVQES